MVSLIIGDKSPELDEALIRNIANAHNWLAMIKSGKTFTEIAATETTSKRRIQRVTEWALLATDIVRMIVEGRQPIGLTSSWLAAHAANRLERATQAYRHALIPRPRKS